MRGKMLVLYSLGVLSAAGLSACGGAAVVGAAGAVGGIAYSDRGAKSQVKGDVNDVNRKAETAFKDMKIQTTKTEVKEAGSERELEGKTPGKDVTVSMKRVDKNTTEVEVIAREGTVKWNKDYAKSVLSKIIAQA